MSGPTTGTVYGTAAHVDAAVRDRRDAKAPEAPTTRWGQDSGAWARTASQPVQDQDPWASDLGTGTGGSWVVSIGQVLAISGSLAAQQRRVTNGRAA